MSYERGVISHDLPHCPERDRIYERLRAIESDSEGELRAFKRARDRSWSPPFSCFVAISTDNALRFFGALCH